MTVLLEWKKMKRSGFLPAFLGGGIFAALVPLINMAVRSQNFVGLSGEPIQILLEANWQMMAMVNVLLVVTGACILYQNEYEERGLQKMSTLPIQSGRLFLGKFLLLAAAVLGILFLEFASIAFCAQYWFAQTEEFGMKLLKNGVYSLMMMMPSIMAMLVIASLFENMWFSLGIGVLCVFAATMIGTRDQVLLSIFPFATAFRTWYTGGMEHILWYVGAAILETILFGILGWIVGHVFH